MKNQFAYPAKVVQDGKFFVITFRDVPQAITQANSKEEIVSASVDLLKDVVSIYMDNGDAFPLASARQKGEVLIELPLSFAAKIVLYNTMKKKCNYIFSFYDKTPSVTRFYVEQMALSVILSV